MDMGLLTLPDIVLRPEWLPCAAWTILNKSDRPKRVLMKRQGNESGQYKDIPPHTSVTLPEDRHYRFWDAETHIEIQPKRQVIVNRDGFFE